MSYKLYRQNWEESERGWGRRPDGYSLHLKLADVTGYIKEYWDSMPDDVPDEYSLPVGNPYPIEATEDDYMQVCKSKFGVRKW